MLAIYMILTMHTTVGILELAQNVTVRLSPHFEHIDEGVIVLWILFDLVLDKLNQTSSTIFRWVH